MNRDKRPWFRYDVCKSWLVADAEFVGTFGFPKLQGSSAKPDKAIPFDRALRTTIKSQWVHFYLDDHRFECLWYNPNAYLKRLQAFEGVISPDFSVYTTMPLAQQIWNTYRNRALGYWLQKNGVTVIPNVQWGDERSYSFCFDGIPKQSAVAVSTYGCIRNRHDRFYFKKGLKKMVDTLKPSSIINHSNTPDDIFEPYQKEGIPIIHIPNWYETLRKRGTHHG